MKWGHLSVLHIATLLLGAAFIVALYFILKRASRRVQTAVLGILSFAGIAAVGYDMIMWNSPLEYLPLHLCSINAMLLPIVVFTRSKTLGNMLMVWSLGAFAALIFNYAVAETEVPGWTFFFYWFPHVVEFGIPILLFKLGLVKKDPKCIGSTIGLTMGIYTVVHLINLALNAYCAANNVLDWAGNVIKVNYMYSLYPQFPALEVFYNLIPYPYWYMYAVVPIVAVYLLILYTPQFVAMARAKKTEKQAA